MWIGNCVAIGLSANFVEPLEATSIGTSISQAYLLANYLLNYDEGTIEFVNKQVNSIMDNIRDFVFLHYLTDRNDTQFWQDIKKIEMPDTLKEKMKLWKNRLPYAEDFSSQSDYCLFFDSNYIVKLFGLNLLNLNSVKEEYNSYLDNFKGEFAAYTESKIAARIVASVFKNKELVSKIRQNQCPVSWPL